MGCKVCICCSDNSFEGLNYVTVDEISGFDITESEGLITILSNKEIETTSKEKLYKAWLSTLFATNVAVAVVLSLWFPLSFPKFSWFATMTYLNLDVDQSANYGKKLNTNIVISKNAKAE